MYCGFRKHIHLLFVFLCVVSVEECSLLHILELVLILFAHLLLLLMLVVLAQHVLTA